MSSESPSSTIEQKLITELGNTLLDKGVSTFLDSILGGGSDGSLEDIKKELDALKQAIENIQATLANFIKIYQATAQFQTLTLIISPAVSDLEANYDKLAGLKKTPEYLPRAKELADARETFASDLITISDVFAGRNAAAPLQLLAAAAEMIIATITSPGYQPTDYGGIQTAYQNFESYFHGLANVQIKGSVLAVNGFQANQQPDLAQSIGTALGANLGQQALWFLSAVESITAAYHHDYTLLDSLTVAPELDVIRQAQAFIQRYPAARGARVWAWTGQGQTFNVTPATPMTATLQLTGFTLPNEDPRSYTLQAEPADGVVTYNNFGDTWNMARFALANVDPGIYTWKSGGPNVCARPLESPPLRLQNDFTVADGSYSAFTVATTMKPTNSLPLYFLSSPNRESLWNSGTYTVEMWLRVDADGRIMSWSPYPDQADDFLLLVCEGGLLKWGSSGDETITALPHGYGQSFHVSLPSDGNSIGFYLNGVFITSGVFGSVSVPSNLYRAATFNEVRMWNRQLSADEIAANRLSMLNGGAGLVAAYGLEQGSTADRLQSCSPLDSSKASFSPVNDLNWFI